MEKMESETFNVYEEEIFLLGDELSKEAQTVKSVDALKIIWEQRHFLHTVLYLVKGSNYINEGKLRSIIREANESVPPSLSDDSKHKLQEFSRSVQTRLSEVRKKKRENS